jgi:hypothetical protein
MSLFGRLFKFLKFLKHKILNLILKVKTNFAKNELKTLGKGRQMPQA